MCHCRAPQHESEDVCFCCKDGTHTAVLVTEGFGTRA